MLSSRSSADPRCRRPRRARRLAGRLAPAALALLLAACAIVPFDEAPGRRRPRYDPEITIPPGGAGIDLWLEDREIVRANGGQPLLRLRFSFLGYDGWIGERDEHRATGTIWFPVDGSGIVRRGRLDDVLITEYPPGTSATRFPFFAEYGSRAARELGRPVAIVDVRGPIAREVSFFGNPNGTEGETFRDEEQFALSQLESWRATLDWDLLHETWVARAWLQAIEAVDRAVRRETDGRGASYVLVAEGLGALGAVRAATVDERVGGLAITGWPLDRRDLEIVRARRWEREAGVFELNALQPVPWSSSRALAEFLSTTWLETDPVCPACPGTGDAWMAQYDYLTLRADGRLDGVAALVLVGEDDPRFPIDLEARVSTWIAGSGRTEGAPPHPVQPGARLYDGASSVAYLGSRKAVTPFESLVYEPGRSTLAGPSAAAAVRAWGQQVGGYHDPPQILLHEAIVDGNHRFDVVVREGNAPVLGVDVRVLETGASESPDFKWSMHARTPRPPDWRPVEVRYVGHDRELNGWWTVEQPDRTIRNRVWSFAVRTRVGDVEATHALPVIVEWNLGDPAGPPRLPDPPRRR